MESFENEPFAFGKAVEEHRATAVETTALRFRNAPDGSPYLGAFECGILVGIATFIRETGLKERHKGRIYGVYVTPAQRRRDVGRQLIGALLKESEAGFVVGTNSAGSGQLSGRREAAIPGLWLRDLWDGATCFGGGRQLC